MTVYCI